jgi:hypothetical protein
VPGRCVGCSLLLCLMVREAEARQQQLYERKVPARGTDTLCGEHNLTSSLARECTKPNLSFIASGLSFPLFTHIS